MKTLDEAIKKYPDPRFMIWYRTKFPKKQFIIVEIVLFAVGFISSVVNKSDIPVLYFIKALATILFSLFLVPAAVCHTIAWVLMRRTERKRAKFMGITLQQYYNLL